MSKASAHFWEVIRRAFEEFLTIPSFVIVGFLILAAITFLVDQSITASTGDQMSGLFSDVEASREFLGVVGTSIITVTSITLSLLLIAVQQGATALTSLVFDQFLRRKSNQFYFGFFIGLAVYSLVILASINPSHRPEYGVIVTAVMTIAALYMLILLIYTTINQMRPVVIIKAIRDHTLLARERQLELVRRTRRSPRCHAGMPLKITAHGSGYLVRLDIDSLTKAAAAAQAEIVVLHSIGDYVAFGAPIAEVRASRLDTTEGSCAQMIRCAIGLEDQRDLDRDPGFGIEELTMIAWTSISTAKSNPAPGLLVINSLRDVLTRWLRTDPAFASEAAGIEVAPIVYADNVPVHLLRALESLAVVATESMQHQSAAEIYRAFARVFLELPPGLQRQASDILLRSLSGLGDHILTNELDGALAALLDVVADTDRKCADAIAFARCRLAASIGKLHSRATRVTAGDE